MTSKKSFSDFRRENEQDYHKRFVEPFDEGLRILEEKKKLAEENPEAALKDPFILAVSGFREKLEKSKVRLEQSARNLLLAHAGGAVLTINMLPSIMENKVLLKKIWFKDFEEILESLSANNLKVATRNILRFMLSNIRKLKKRN